MLTGARLIGKCKATALGSRFTEALGDLQLLAQPYSQLSGPRLATEGHIRNPSTGTRGRGRNMESESAGPIVTTQGAQGQPGLHGTQSPKQNKASKQKHKPKNRSLRISRVSFSYFL